MSGQEIYEWLKRHQGKMLASFQIGNTRVLAPVISIGLLDSKSEWVLN